MYIKFSPVTSFMHKSSKIYCNSTFSFMLFFFKSYIQVKFCDHKYPDDGTRAAVRNTGLCVGFKLLMPENILLSKCGYCRVLLVFIS
jgi:hypothetical protein